MPGTGREDIKALEPRGARPRARRAGRAAFRAGQIERWLYARGVRSFDEMTDLPAGLRDGAVASASSLRLPALEERQVSEDGTRKYLWRLADGDEVETVGMPEGDRLTVCFSTQAGCAMGCAFCATGRGGFVRDLTAGEMVDQVRARRRGLRQAGDQRRRDGAGRAVRELRRDARRAAVPERRATASASARGTSPSRRAGSSDRHPALRRRARAVHARRLAPLGGAGDPRPPHARRTPRSRSRTAARALDRVRRAHRAPADARVRAHRRRQRHGRGAQRRSSRFCRGLLCHVNLIPVNPVEHSGLRRSPADRGRAFVEALARKGVEASVRRERGADIDAACGQLRQRGG